MSLESRILDHLTFLYGPEAARQVWSGLRARLTSFLLRNPHLPGQKPPLGKRLTERDVVLITYGDQISEPGKPPLQTLTSFLRAQTQDIISFVHLLPFYPYSSDDGFSVIDYRQVNPALGTWEDIQELRQTFRLMFDAVINHISRESQWFQGFLRGEPPYDQYFITVDPDTDLSMVVRPRALPLLTPVETAKGTQYVWTTFSADQIDLNYANPQVLLEIVDVLLFYVEQGAEIIRLDAIAYLWKEIGTPCIHLPQTHRVVKIFRQVLDMVAPYVILLTETNVPHEENISYFGDGTDEAQMVYQFPLPPLILHTIHTGNARHLQRWAAGLSTPSPETTFFNFLASHDGIGVNPARGILSDEEIDALIERTKAHGGYVSYKSNPDGSKSPYELNISFFDALSDPNDASESLFMKVERFVVAHAIMFALRGVPGLYIHSLLGSCSDHAAVAETGQYRAVNRQKFRRNELESELLDTNSRRFWVFNVLKQILRQRRANKAFHPNGAQKILPSSEGLFNVLRTAPDFSQNVLCLHNISAEPQPCEVYFPALSLPPRPPLHDLITNSDYTADASGRLSVMLQPYQVMWLNCGPSRPERN